MEKKYWNLSLAAVLAAVIVFAILIITAGTSAEPAKSKPTPLAPTKQDKQIFEVVTVQEAAPTETQSSTTEAAPQQEATAVPEEAANPAQEPLNILKVTQNKIEFFKSGNKTCELQFSKLNTPGAMKAAALSQDKQSYYFQKFSENTVDCADYLIDLKGDGSKHYMIVVDQANDQYTGKLVDFEKGIVLGSIPVGNTVEYPVSNPDLVFEYSEAIAADQAETQLKVKLMLRENQEPLCVSAVQNIFELEKYDLKQVSPQERTNMLTRLYCDLANAGMIKYALKYAKQVGFTDKEIILDGGKVLEKIRQSKLYPYIYKLNGERP